MGGGGKAGLCSLYCHISTRTVKSKACTTHSSNLSSPDVLIRAEHTACIAFIIASGPCASASNHPRIAKKVAAIIATHASAVRLITMEACSVMSLKVTSLPLFSTDLAKSRSFPIFPSSQWDCGSVEYCSLVIVVFGSQFPFDTPIKLANLTISVDVELTSFHPTKSRQSARKSILVRQSSKLVTQSNNTSSTQRR
jgi:hypothetical protein